jgi:putative multicomponent Na+:H+ antiporter subunit B
MTSAITDLDLFAIVALLPIAAVMTLLQKNPYHALVVRGILGAIAALVYSLLGAADVALTEALVGTMLAITLYIIAVRSSLVLRLGVLSEGTDAADGVAAPALLDEPEVLEVLKTLTPKAVPADTSISTMNEIASDLASDHPSATDLAIDASPIKPLLVDLRNFCRQHFLRLELLPYPNRDALDAALEACDIHAIGLSAESALFPERPSATHPPYALIVRVPRLYDLMQTELNSESVDLRPTFVVDTPDSSSISAVPHP